MSQLPFLLPLVIYLLLTAAIALWARRASAAAKENFLQEYFIGSRAMGGFVLAMAIITSYVSASSFVGGVGIAYKMGLSWVLLSMIQVPTAFLTLGILGNRLALLARRTKAVTIADVLRARYESDAVVIVCSVALILFFMAAMVAQFIGGARLFQALTGYPYAAGLLFFGLLVILYTSIGGFRAVVLTDAIQGLVMLAAVLVLVWVVIDKAGGTAQAIQTLYAIDPGLITPTGPQESLPQPMMLSFWILVGIGVLGLPQSIQKSLGYKNASAAHTAMLLGTLIIGFLMLCLTLTGALGRAVFPDLPANDLVMPTLTMKLLDPVWAGIFIAGPLAAIMSTVDSMLLMVAATLIKDLYLHHWHKGDARQLPARKLEKTSLLCTLALGIVVMLAALEPPAFLVWINLFAFGGLEVVFLWPVLLGLYWPGANATGALCSMGTGLLLYILLSAAKIKPAGLEPVVIAIALSLAAFFAGNRWGKAPRQEVIALFFGTGK